MSTQLDQIGGKAKSNPKLRFTSLVSMITLFDVPVSALFDGVPATRSLLL